MHTVWVERRKWPDHPHYGHDATWLGEDERGTWLALTPGRPIYRGDTVLFVAEGAGGVVLVPRGEWWMAWFLFVNPEADTPGGVARTRAPSAESPRAERSPRSYRRSVPPDTATNDTGCNLSHLRLG